MIPARIPCRWARIRTRSALGFALVSLLAAGGAARADSVPPALVCNIVLRVLAMDTGLPARSSGKLIITVIGDDEIYETFAKLRGTKVGGKVVLADVVRGDSGSDPGASAVLFAGAGADPAKVTAISRSKRILTVTNVPNYVVEGVTLGIGIEAGKPKVLLNLSSAAEEKIEFKPQLLKLARTMR